MKNTFEKIVIIDDHAYGITSYSKLMKRSSFKLGEEVIFLCMIPGRLEAVRFFMKKEYPNASIVDNSQPRYMALERKIRESVEEYHNLIINKLSFPLHIFFISETATLETLKEDSENLNPTTQVVRDVMKAVSKFVRLPKVVRDGIVKKK